MKSWIRIRINLIRIRNNGKDNGSGTRSGGGDVTVPENSVDSEVAEEVLVLAEDLAAEGGTGDVHQVLPASRTVPIQEFDPYVFGPRIRIRNYLHGSGSFYQQAKKLRETTISTVL